MSGFSTQWLKLREPADHNARDKALLTRLADHFAGRETIRLTDLGCGTGSNLRAMAPMLPMRQSWRLVDYDQQLLEAARAEIALWRERSAVGKPLDLRFEIADLSADVERVLDEDTEIVTASALFDLVSESWLERFVAAMAGRRLAFYTVLIFDGVMRWRPAHPADERIGQAFCAHQGADKGFGPAAGPQAGRILAALLSQAGYRVATAESAWRLEQCDHALITATAKGIAEAARETGLVPESEIASWLASRSRLDRCEIGHVDVLALPT